MSSELITTGLPQPQGLGEDPLFFFTRVYLSFLQGLFAQFDAGSYKWSSDEKLTEITITDQAPFPKDRLELRPAIVTMRGPAQFGNLSLDNLESVDAKTGKRRHTDLVSCTMTLNCIAKMGLEAQRLGWIVFTNLRRFNRLLQRGSGMHQVGNQVSMSQETPPGSLVSPEADSEMTMVTVQSPFYFKWSEEITPLDTVTLREIDAHMTSVLAPPDSTKLREETVLRRPTVRGVPIGMTSIPLDPSRILQTVKS